MAQMELEPGVLLGRAHDTQKSFWERQEEAGFVEVDGRRRDDVEYRLLWHKTGGLLVLAALRDSGESALTTVDDDSFGEVLDHPTNYFSHEATDRLYPKAA